MARRFFSDSSFWNQRIARDAKVDSKSEHWVGILAGERDPNLWLNLDKWTIPVYEVDEHTPRRQVQSRESRLDPKRSGHGVSFEQPVPIPDHAIPDPMQDSHIALVDYGARKIWDMFFAHRHEDGEWDSLTGMTYDMDGDGIFHDGDFPVQNGESIHLYGPGRAAGVPIVAGLIMYDEVQAGRIDHKLAFATGCNAHQEYVFPATWTDGFTEGGLPEGCVIQLDPSLDLDSLDLSPAAKTIAKALQEYGAVNVDVAGGSVIYAEGLYGQDERTWMGILNGDALRGIDINRYRVLKTPDVKRGGRFHPPERRGTWCTRAARGS
jgi:hypothetical protein